MSLLTERFQNAAKRTMTFSKKPIHKRNKEDEILGVDITLGNTKMIFTDNGWELDGSMLTENEKRIDELTHQLAEVQYRATKSASEIERVRNGGEKTIEEANMIKFKNQLLIEMLAISQLDETLAIQNYQREKLKSEEYKLELERCYSRMLSLGIDPSTVSGAAAGGGRPSLTSTITTTTTTVDSVFDKSYTVKRSSSASGFEEVMPPYSAAAAGGVKGA